jgi:hypothetical protein
MSIRFSTGIPVDAVPADAAINGLDAPIASPRPAVPAVVRKWRLFNVI